METREFLNRKTGPFLTGNEVTGDLFGVELELEGRNVGLRDVATRGWRRTDDGSLRGESVEFVTAGGKTFDEVQKLVKELFDKFTKNGVVFNNSIRTSTHVHLNFSDKTFKQAVNFFTLFTLFEELLQFYSGEDRKGNVFCISTREAEGIVEVLSKGLASGSLDGFGGDRYKYAACNLCTLYKFGTVEVRTMRGATSADQVNKWINILNDLYQYSLRMVSPAELVTNLSLMGAEVLMRSIFSKENCEELMTTFPKSHSLHHSLMEGARTIQILAFQFDEDFRAKVDLKEIAAKDHNKFRWAMPNGGTCAVYMPNGASWSVAPLGRGRRFFEDGDVVKDEQRCKWVAALQRFVVFYPDGRELPCNWKRHPTIPDEGPPRPGHANCDPFFEPGFRARDGLRPIFIEENEEVVRDEDDDF